MGTETTKAHEEGYWSRLEPRYLEGGLLLNHDSHFLSPTLCYKAMDHQECSADLLVKPLCYFLNVKQHMTIKQA